MMKKLGEVFSPAALAAKAALGQRAVEYRDGFPAIRWSVETQGQRQECVLKGAGNFEGFPPLRGGELVFEAEVRFPLESRGLTLDGSSFEVTINSLYPLRLECNGKTVFEDLSRVPVAAGPALIDLSGAVSRNGVARLRQTVFFPDFQIASWWHQLRFTTASLRQGFEMFDILAAQLELAMTVAGEAGEIAACENAAALAAAWLEGGAPGPAEEFVREFESALEPVRQKTDALSVHLVGHSHIDLNWLWTWPDTREVIRRDFRSVLALMDDFPELTFSHSQPATYEVIAREEPALFEKVLGHIRSGRWEAISMTWVEQDSNIASGESHARQLLQGVQYTQEKLGVRPVVYHAPDTFGHPGNIPQLAASAGAEFYYHHRCNPGGNWLAYWWEGHDGTRILALSTATYNGSITAGELVRAAARAHAQGLSCGLHFHGIGDHGGGPTRQSLEALARLRHKPFLPVARFSTLERFGREMLAVADVLPVFQGESRTIFEGCYTTHGDTKAYNRCGENLLQTAETLAVLAGLDARDALGAAWRRVLFNQFHDIAAGSAIHEVYAGHADDFRDVQSAADQVIRSALAILSAAGADGGVQVVNPLAFPRKDWVFLAEEAEGSPLPWAQRVEGGWGVVAKAPGLAIVSVTADTTFSSGSLNIAPAYAPFDNREDNMLGDAAREAPYFRIETPCFSIFLRRDCGVLVGFFDKRAERELVGFGLRRQGDYLDTARPDLALGVLQIVEEHPHGMSSWQMHEVHSERSLISGAESRIVETGPLRAIVETRHSYGQSEIIQRTIFYAELPWVDFETRIQWKEPGNASVGIPNLKVSFCARLEECEAWFESPFSAVRRPADGQEAPIQRWVDVGGGGYGIALLNDGKYGCDVLGPRLRLSLVRSAYDPDPIADLGGHLARYRFVPHEQSWREAGIPQLAASFNQPLLAHRKTPGQPAAGGTRPAIRPILSGSENIFLSGLKQAESGEGVILRLCEGMGQAGTVEISGLPSDWGLTETDLVERVQASVSKDRNGVRAIAFSPWQVRTFLATPDRPVR